MNFRWVFHGGELVQDVTSVTLANNTAKTVDTVVPSGKRWLLLSIKVTNPDNVDRVVVINKWKEAAATNKIKTYLSTTVTAGGAVERHTGFTPSSTSNQVGIQYPEILDEGNLIRASWAAGGASAGATDADGLVIEYLEIDL